jgi:low affinity Fe/Cu permease
MSQLSRQHSASAGWFNRFAGHTARIVGSPWAFLCAIASIIIWLVLGPMLHWSDAWQLIINSVSNIATYLVVFVIQNSQTRDSDAINLKLNELIAASHSASNELINVEDLSDQELKSLFERYENIRKEWDRRREQ